MPKKKKGKKEGKKGSKADADAKDKDSVKKQFEAPGASEKEIILRTECVLNNAHHKFSFPFCVIVQTTRIRP